MKYKIKFLGLILGVLFILIAGTLQNANAFGVSSPYWQGNPVIMYPGETKIVNLNLQNNIGEDDVFVKVSILEGQDIARVEKELYTVKAKTIDTYVPVKVYVPKDAQISGTYPVKVEFRTVAGEGAGMVTFGTGMKVSFDVQIVEVPQAVKEKQQTTIWIIIGVVILVLLIIIFWLLRRKPSQRISQTMSIPKSAKTNKKGRQ